MCGLGVSHSGTVEVVRPAGLHDWLTVKERTPRGMPGLAGGLYCPSSNKSTRRKGRLRGGRRHPHVLLRWVFGYHRGHLGSEVQLVASKSRLTPIYLFGHILGSSPIGSVHFCQTHFFHSVQWVVGLPGQQDIYNVSPMCQALWSSLLYPNLNPFAQFRSTQSSGLGFNVIFSGKASLTTPAHQPD